MNEEATRSKAPIRDVSDTAFMIAAYRALESGRPDALFHDPLAERVAGERGRKIVAGLSKTSGVTCWSVALRTRIIDDFIQSVIEQGVDTVLNLGAGLDTRPYRMALPEALNWIEVDYPHVIEWKEDRLAGETPVCKLERIKLDLADRASRRKMLSAIGSQARRVLVLTEGVVPYLHNEEAATLAEDLYSQPSFGYWIVDYFALEMLKWRSRSAISRSLKNAPWHFRPDDYFAFFGQRGWHAGRIRYFYGEARRHRRPAPLPLTQKFAFMSRYLLASRARREKYRQLAGYVLFERLPAGTKPAE